MGLAGAGAADEDDVSGLFEEAAGVEIPDQCFVDLGFREAEGIQILMNRELGNAKLIFNGTGFSFRSLSQSQRHQDVLYGVVASYSLGNCFIINANHPVQLQCPQLVNHFMVANSEEGQALAAQPAA